MEEKLEAGSGRGPQGEAPNPRERFTISQMVDALLAHKREVLASGSASSRAVAAGIDYAAKLMRRRMESRERRRERHYCMVSANPPRTARG